MHLEACRTNLAAHADFEPFAVLNGDSSYRFFKGEDDEVPSDFARRLKREASQIRATWAFSAMIAPARVRVAGEESIEIPIGDVKAIETALDNGQLDLALCWSATLREQGENLYRGGVMFLDNNGDIQQEVEARLNPATDPFSEILS